MCFTSTLALFVAAFIVSAMNFTDAEDAALSYNTPVPNYARIDFDKKVLRLKRRQERDDEERKPPVAAYYYLLHSSPTTSTQASQILHAVEDDKPPPKDFLTVVGLGVITGGVVGAVKITQMVNNKPDSS
ncbi:hypothetical protein GQ600_6936 [Phytophthora cactorum]|nr:hypothetical protein GQ600_6936 [Phytophthora cactorum]